MPGRIFLIEFLFFQHFEYVVLLPSGLQRVYWKIKILSLFLTFDILIIMCLGELLWVQYFWNFLGFLDLDVSFLPRIRGIFSNYVFKFKFSAPSSLYSFWHFCNANVLWLWYLVLIFSLFVEVLTVCSPILPLRQVSIFMTIILNSTRSITYLIKFFFNGALSCSFIWTIVLLLDSTL